MTLYDLNKQGYLSLQDMEPIVIDRIFDANINNFLLKDNHKIYMLLSNERRDYTVFMKNKNSNCQLLIAIKEVLQNRGKIKGIEVNNDSVDFWVAIDNECYLYKLFNYTWGVIKV